MSGIAGTYYLGGHPASGEEVGRMIRTMARRGPDGAGVWASGAVGLGHCALHVTPESLHEKLPLVSDAGHAVLTSDLRLDNREELGDRLGMKPTGTAPITDAEIVLAAYERWGEECVSELLGDFALAIWDEREQKLLLVRDHFGVKQLYYVHIPGVLLAFASEPKALLTLPQVSEGLNEVYLANLLALNLKGLDLEATIHRQIKRVPQAHVITASEGSFRKRCYWRLEEPEELRLGSDEEYAESFREVFEEAVRCRTRSAFPVATELSGGLDSSFVACLARDYSLERGLGPVHAISLTFDKFPNTDERPFIEEVLATGGFTPHFVPTDELGPLSCLDEVFEIMDDPSWSGGAHAYIHARTKVAADAGARVLLTGYDGDSVVGHGYEYLSELAEEGRWDVFAREAGLIAERCRGTTYRQSIHDAFASPNGVFRAYGEPYLRWCADHGHYARFARAAYGISRHLRVPQRAIYRAYWRRLLSSRRALEAQRGARTSTKPQLPGIPLLDKELVARTGVGQQEAPEGSLLSPRPSTLRERHLAFFQSSKTGYSLEGVGLNAAGLGLEVRHPFMDKRLLEFCVALPSNQRLRDGWPRMIQRRAMAGVVPDAVRWRAGKARVTAPFFHGLLEVDRTLLVQLTNDLGRLEEYVDAQALRALRDEALRTNGADMDPRTVAIVGHIGAIAHWFGSRTYERPDSTSKRFEPQDDKEAADSTASLI